MSVQSEINRLKQNVNAAFTAIGNKGGTVPGSKVSGNLASAIDSIPTGATLKTANGTFTSSGSNELVTVNCGFKPDIVRIVSALDPSIYEVSVDFNLTENVMAGLFMGSDDDTYPIWMIVVEQTENGFKFGGNPFDYSWYPAFFAKDFAYKALKYTG